ncbi:MAG: AIR synthase-related protein, partial [Saprospiraceae bacterium]
PAPHFDLEEEFLLHKTIQQLIRKSWVQSAHDISEGGLFCCLAESCFSENQKGFFIEIPETYRKDIFLFGENQGRAVLTIKPENKAEFELFLQQNGQKFHYLGEVTKGELVINEQNFGSTRDYFELYSKSISNQF